MPYVNLHLYRGKRIYLSDEDLTANGQGYLIVKHWTAWVWFGVQMFMLACLLAIAVIVAQMFDVDLRSSGAIFAGAIALALLLKFVWVGYMAVSRAFILITPGNVFYSRMEKWFKQVIDPMSIDSVNFRTTSLWTAGFPDIRTVYLNTEGDRPDIEFTFAAGGDEIARGWQRTTAATKD
jgi:hypothetical protein